MKFKCFLLLTAVLLSAGLAMSQTTAEVLGTVTDASGAVLTGARIRVTNLATNVEYNSATNNSGQFRVPLLPPGRYEVTVEAPGFARYVLTDVVLQLNQQANLSIQMEVAGTTEVVNVSGEVPLVNTTNAEVGVNFDNRRITELPLSPNRNILTLALQVSGVSQLSNGNQGFASGGVNFAVNGMRARSNNFMIDGADSNNASVSGLVQEINNPDTVSEFRLITNQFLPEYGRAAGSVVNILTKSGTNSYHGSLYWFHNSNPLNSRSNLDERVFSKAPWRIENQVAGTVGGPIVKDKTFFFGSLLRWTDRQFASGQTIQGAPTAEGQTLLRNIAGTRPQVRALLENLPAAQTPSGSFSNVTLGGVTTRIPLGSLAGAAPNKLNAWQSSARVDHRFSDRHTLGGRMLFDTRESVSGQAVPPGLTSQSPARRQAYNAFLTSTFSPNVFNEFRANFQRFFSETSAADPKSLTIPNLEVAELGLVGFNAAASRTAIGLAVNLPQAQVLNNYQIVNNFSILKGSHSVKFGIDFRRQDQNQDFNPTLRGRLNYVTLQDLVDDVANVQAINSLMPGLPNWQGYKYYDYFFFIQDQWRVTNRLTLSYGIRYESPGNAFAWLQSQNTKVLAANNNNAGFRMDPAPPRDTNNWAPRFGFNYRFGKGPGVLRIFTGEENLVIRGGYSRTYDMMFNNIALNIYSAFPFTLVTQRAARTPGAFAFIDGIRAGTIQPPVPANPMTVTRTIVTQDFRAPVAEQFSLQLQRQVTNSWAFTISYVGTKGTGLFQTLDGNPCIAGTRCAQRLDTARGIIRTRSNSASSIYHSMQTSVEKRLSANFSMAAHYTWSAMIDTASEVFNPSVQGEVAVPQDSFNWRADRGRSTYDRPHRFVVNGVYEFPFFREQKGIAGKVLGGWNVGGFLTFQSGSPFTPLDGADPGFRLTGIDGLVGNAIRPHVNTTLDLSRMSVEQIFNAGGRNLFSRATADRPIGNAGRNILRSDGLNNIDMVVNKTIKMPWESHSLNFRSEFYNLSNTRDFGIPISIVANTGFGNQWNTGGGNRRIVLGLRYLF